MKARLGKYLSIVVLLPLAAQARDEGFALECQDSETGQRQYVSFLEVGTDKRVNFLETTSRTLWDDHEWLNERVVISSFMQMQSEDKPRLTARMEIDKESLAAVYRRFGEQVVESKMQCVNWSPQTRNK